MSQIDKVLPFLFFVLANSKYTNYFLLERYRTRTFLTQLKQSDKDIHHVGPFEEDTFH